MLDIPIPYGQLWVYRVICGGGTGTSPGINFKDFKAA